MPTQKKKVNPVKILLALAYLLALSYLPFLLAGDWLWLEGWLYNLWFLLLCFGVIAYLYKKNPGLLAERFKKPGTGRQKGWDVFLIYGLQFTFLVWLVIIPLDAKRYGWTLDFPWQLKVLGGILLLLCSLLIMRAYTDNSFLSALVRVQKDRKQKVVSTGVYGFVRHPMYLGGVLLFFGAPLLMSSKFGILAGAFLTLMIVARIYGEEAMLSKELKGYAAYRKKVRYRLVPYLW